MPGGWTVRPWLHRMRGVKIGKNVWISQMVYIDENHPETITIGNNCTIGIRTSIINHLYWGPLKKQNESIRILIGNDVFIGPHCVILPNVQIGDGAVVIAGTVVKNDIPPYTLWGQDTSQPLAKVTVTLTKEHSYEEFIRGLKPFRIHKS